MVRIYYHTVQRAKTQYTVAFLWSGPEQDNSCTKRKSKAISLQEEGHISDRGHFSLLALSILVLAQVK